MSSLEFIRTKRFLLFLLTFIGVFNIMDYFLTEIALFFGAKELNPLVLIMMDSFSYSFIKIGLITVFLVMVWAVRDRINKFVSVIMIVLWVTFVCYFSVIVWHVYGLITVINTYLKI